MILMAGIKHKDTAINQTNQSSVYRLIEKAAQPSAQFLIVQELQTEFQEHTNKQYFILRGIMESSTTK